LDCIFEQVYLEIFKITSSTTNIQVKSYYKGAFGSKKILETEFYLPKSSYYYESVYQLCYSIKDNTENLIDIESDFITTYNNLQQCWFDGSIFLNGKDAPTFDSWRVVNVHQNIKEYENIKKAKRDIPHYLIIMKQYKHMSKFVEEQKGEEKKDQENFSKYF